jgi:hypothetical protein
MLRDTVALLQDAVEVLTPGAAGQDLASGAADDEIPPWQPSKDDVLDQLAVALHLSPSGAGFDLEGPYINQGQLQHLLAAAGYDADLTDAIAQTFGREPYALTSPGTYGYRTKPTPAFAFGREGGSWIEGKELLAAVRQVIGFSATAQAAPAVTVPASVAKTRRRKKPAAEPEACRVCKEATSALLFGECIGCAALLNTSASALYADDAPDSPAARGVLLSQALTSTVTTVRRAFFIDVEKPPAGLSGAQAGVLFAAANAWVKARLKAPKCARCGVAGKVVDLPSQFENSSDLACCDVICVDVLVAAGLEPDQGPETQLHICGRCHDALLRQVEGKPAEEPAAKPKRSRKAKVT